MLHELPHLPHYSATPTYILGEIVLEAVWFSPFVNAAYQKRFFITMLADFKDLVLIKEE